jgi:hypothetical protein
VRGLLPPGQRLYSLAQIQIPVTPGSEQRDLVVSSRCSRPNSYSNFARPTNPVADKPIAYLIAPKGGGFLLFHAQIENCAGLSTKRIVTLECDQEARVRVSSVALWVIAIFGISFPMPFDNANTGPEDWIRAKPR